VTVLISAIMPTRGRPEWAAQAVECFRRQTFPHRELIILDDHEEPSFEDDAFLHDDAIHYSRLHRRWNIPVKRNMAVRLAVGAWVAHWDSDDWSAPDRMDDQIVRLQRSQKAVTGYSSMYFWDEQTSQAFQYTGPPHFAIGTSLCYQKAWWRLHPFQERLMVEEDNAFVLEAARANELVVAEAGALMVARAHAGNTSAKVMHRAEYRPVPKDALPAGFFQ
jgi:glycosyltransferase involved in cell wall biosynthesis